MKIVYSPFPTEEAAKTAATTLLEKKLIACANVVKSSSLYMWEERLKDETEWILIGKTDRDITKEIETLHPYDCPCVLIMDAEANAAYSEWVGKQLNT